MDSPCEVSSCRSSREYRVVPNPAAFFDILSETDDNARSRKISTLEYRLPEDENNLRSLFLACWELPGVSVSVGFASVFDGIDLATYNEMPLLLRQLAGDIYVEKDRLMRLGSLGEGGFAVVDKMELVSEDRTTREIVAVKKLKPGVIEDDQDLKELIEESNVLRKLQHRGIVEFKGIGCMDDSSVESMRESIFLAEEFMGGGTLKHMILNQMRVSPFREYWMRDAWNWLMQISEALSYLHLCTPSVIHRDVKPENVLMSSRSLQKAVAKIADFGLHKRMNKISQRQREISTGLLDTMTIDSKQTDPTTSLTNHPEDSEKSTELKQSEDLSNYSMDLPNHFRILKKSSSLSFCSTHRDSSLEVVPEDSPVEGSLPGYLTLTSAFSVPQMDIQQESSPIHLILPAEPPKPIPEPKLDLENLPTENLERDSNASLETVVSESMHDRKVRGGHLLATQEDGKKTLWHQEGQQLMEKAKEEGQKSQDPISSRSSLTLHFLYEANRHQLSTPSASPHQAQPPPQSTTDHGKTLLESKQHGSSHALDQLVNEKAPEEKLKKSKDLKKTICGGLPLGLSASKLALDLSGTNVVSGIVGSLLYMAPEVYKGKHYDEKVDVFGFGILMYELFSSELILVRVLSKALAPSGMKKLLKKHAKAVAKGYREEIPEDWPIDLQELVYDCWHQDPAQRPCFPEIIERLKKIKDNGHIEIMDKNLAALTKTNMSGCFACCRVS